jgi:purine-cytosine permease-like protein
MSADSQPGSAALIERGIEIVPESERTARPRDLFWPWFAANVSVFGMSYGSFLLGFGISLWQATLVAIIGIVVSFALRTHRDRRQARIRADHGAVPGGVRRAGAEDPRHRLVADLDRLGDVAHDHRRARDHDRAARARLGGRDGDVAVHLIATVLVAALIVGASVLGYHTIMRLQSVLTWLTGAFTILFLILTVGSIDWTKAFAHPDGTLAQTIGALVMVMTGFGLGWINIAADWSRYQKRTASDAQIVTWNTIGGSVAPSCWCSSACCWRARTTSSAPRSPPTRSARSRPCSRRGRSSRSSSSRSSPRLRRGARHLLLGPHAAEPGHPDPRPAAAAVDGVILTIGTIVVFFAQNFIGPFQSFLITLGVPMAAWAGILIADILRRKKDYDEAALFDSRGRYGAWDGVSIGTLVVASVIGWGFVINTFAEAAPWNNWQGYFLGLIGGKTESGPTRISECSSRSCWASS